MGFKLAVIGGGSTYSPEFVAGLTDDRHALDVDELVLMDPDPVRLGVVGAFCGRLLDAAGWRGTLRLTNDRDDAIRDAAFVLLQLRVGGQAGRHLDESLARQHGLIGQETTGAGGFAMAMRSVPVVLDIAEAVEARGAAGAWIIDFTNPVGIVTQALVDRGARAIGLCNVAINQDRRIADWLDLPPERLVVRSVGLNHLSWVTSVLVDGVERMPQVLERARTDRDHADLWPIAEALAVYPSPYLRYYLRTAHMLREQANAPTRATEVASVEGELLAAYADPTRTERPAALAKRGGALYSEAALRLVASLRHDRGDIQVVNLRNEGAIEGLANDAVVEVPARIHRSGPRPLPIGALHPALEGLVQHVKAYERLAVAAAHATDRALAVQALMANPLVADADVAGPLVDAYLAAHRRHLPATWYTNTR